MIDKIGSIQQLLPIATTTSEELNEPKSGVLANVNNNTVEERLEDAGASNNVDQTGSGVRVGSVFDVLA